MITRLRSWWAGIWPDAAEETCVCGHYRSVHQPAFGCTGYARDQWLTVGRLSWSLPCRCVLTRGEVR
jgi:hypothetical protein